jgi:signal transduction histidine kinase
VVEQGLGNVWRQSGASRVAIELRVPDPDHLTVSVVDDGRGVLPTSRFPAGLGLDAIAAR